MNKKFQACMIKLALNEEQEYCKEILISLHQALGTGLSSALVYIGANPKKITYSLKYSDISMSIPVNGKKGENWSIKISYNKGKDLIDAILYKKGEKILDKKNDIYIDQLKNIIEKMYDDAIKKYNDGFINI